MNIPIPIPGGALPIASPGGVDPKTVQLVAMPSTNGGDASGALPMDHLNVNQAAKTVPKLNSKLPTTPPPPLPPMSLVQLPGKNPHNLYWLPTGDELNGLEDEVNFAEKKREQENAIDMKEKKERDVEEEKEEVQEEEKEEEELQKENPLEREAPIHGSRPFGWTPQLGQPKSTDYLKLNDDAFTTLLEEKKLNIRRHLRIQKKQRATPQPSMEESWSMMQATTPMDDPKAGYVMPAMKPDGEIDIPTDEKGSSDDGKSGGNDIDGIIKEAMGKSEISAAKQVAGDLLKGEKLDFSGIAGR
jgi:hypothetical protein